MALFFVVEFYGDAVSPKRCEIRIKIHGSPLGFGENSFESKSESVSLIAYLIVSLEGFPDL
jgi:hypothetical protein